MHMHMGNTMIDRARILLESLEAHGADDVVIPYRQVAQLFPSNDPHPSSFDYKLIDFESLSVWAESNGWEIISAPESSDSTNSYSFPVRFRRLLSSQELI